jgi:hypothetical protein
MPAILIVDDEVVLCKQVETHVRVVFTPPPPI